LNAIEVENLTKRFGNLTAVDRISFDVKRGEFFGLLGPNGAGKTTTIRMITGVLGPDTGSILVEGSDLRKDYFGAKSKMGVIPEVGNIYTDLSARENIDLTGRFYGLPKALRRERAEQLLTEFGLKDRADVPTRNFSKGMRQRVSIACAMVHEPPILILDEPTEGLDVMDMNLKGTTVILTTHNIEEANQLCQRVCIINKGGIVAIDSPERLRKAAEKMQTVEVAFDRTVDPAVFISPFITKAEMCGDKWRVWTEDPDRVIVYLVQLKEREGLRILSMNTSGPSLEDVFVKLCEVPR